MGYALSARPYRYCIPWLIYSTYAKLSRLQTIERNAMILWIVAPAGIHRIGKTSADDELVGPSGSAGADISEHLAAIQSQFDTLAGF